MDLLLNYLSSKYYEYFRKSIRSFLWKNVDLLEEKISGKIISSFSIFDLDFKGMKLSYSDNDVVNIEVNLSPEIEAITRLPSDDSDSEPIDNLWLSCFCQCKISDSFSDFKILDVDQYYCSFRAKNILSHSLVPIIKKEDITKYSDKILKKFYPTAFTNSNPIEVITLAHNKGLSVIYRRIKEDLSVFGPKG